MSQQKKRSFMKFALVSVLVGSFSMTAAAQHDLTVIAQTGKAIEEITGGSINNAGKIIFDAIDFKSINRVYDEDGDPIVQGYGSTLNENGDFAYLNMVRVGKIMRPAVFKFDTDSQLLLAGQANTPTVGQLSLNNAGELAYWTFQCCDTIESCIRLRDSVGDVSTVQCASLFDPCSLVIGPKINDSGAMAYLRACENAKASATKEIVLLQGDVDNAIFTASSEWILGLPSMNSGNDIAFFVQDAANEETGIRLFMFQENEVTERVSLRGSLVPAVQTSPILNDSRDIAFIAAAVSSCSGNCGDSAGGCWCDESCCDFQDCCPDKLTECGGCEPEVVISSSIEGIYLLKVGSTEPELVLAIGDVIGGFYIEGELQLLGINAGREILFKARGAFESVPAGGIGESVTILGVLRPVITGSCVGDLNNSGIVDVQDLIILLAAWGVNPGHPADLNEDGTVDVLDLITLLAAWGPCPDDPKKD